MERLYQGHLHPKLEVLRLHVSTRNQTQAFAVGGEHSNKELFEQSINSYSEHLHMSPRHGQGVQVSIQSSEI